MMSTKLFKKGTKVIITNDVRKLSPTKLATGETATFVGLAPNPGWTLFGASGEVEHESPVLPEGYIEWQANKKFPAVKCGVSAPVHLFKLKNGSIITSLECYWLPENKKLREQILKEAKHSCAALFRKARQRH